LPMASFLKSATSYIDYPYSEKEILLVGRSNVGKSTFINQYLNQKLAYVGKTPGKTRLLNFYDLGFYTLCDAPGYGYANRSNKELIQYGEMMEEYFRKREALRMIFMLVDARRIPNQDDIDMIEYLRQFHLNIKIIVTKMDKLKQSEIKPNLDTIASKLEVDKSNFYLSYPKKSENLKRFRESIEEELKIY